MFKSHYLFQTERKKLYFKEYINVLTKIKIIYKKKHYESKLKESKSDSQQLQNTIRFALPTNCKHAFATSLR